MFCRIDALNMNLVRLFEILLANPLVIHATNPKSPCLYFAPGAKNLKSLLSVFNLWQMLSKDFVNLMIISCVIAIPIAWYFLHQWLMKYPYRTEISWWIFLFAGMGAMFITLITVSFQAIRAALMNPVSSLRTE